MVMHIGQIPNLKKVSASFLYQGKLAGEMGQLTPSPSYSFIPHTFNDCFMIDGWLN